MPSAACSYKFTRKWPRNWSVKEHGFTLLEVMLVLLLMGLAAGYVVFNAVSVNQADRLAEQVKRLQVIVDMASDFAVLNQQELGIYIDEEKQSYEFRRLQDDEWVKVEENKFYASHVLPENMTMQLTLDGLPWQTEEQLFDREIFDEQLSVRDARVSIGEDEEKAPPPPQILIMSSGEITPFSLLFAYQEVFSNDAPVYFTLNNIDIPPLEVDGPLDAPPL